MSETNKMQHLGANAMGTISAGLAVAAVATLEASPPTNEYCLYIGIADGMPGAGVLTHRTSFSHGLDVGSFFPQLLMRTLRTVPLTVCVRLCAMSLRLGANTMRPRPPPRLAAAATAPQDIAPQALRRFF